MTRATAKGCHDHKGKGQGWYGAPHTKGQKKGDHAGKGQKQVCRRSLQQLWCLGAHGHSTAGMAKEQCMESMTPRTSASNNYTTDVSCVGSGFSMCSINNEITTHNRYDLLQNIDEKITAIEIMTVSTEEKPRRDKMCAIGERTNHN